MPDYAREALTERRLMDAYHERPDYQENDYIGALCVTRAKREETNQYRKVIVTINYYCTLSSSSFQSELSPNRAVHSSM